MPSILIIDDNEMLCNMLSHKVSDMGHRVTHALTLEDGLGRASSETFDVVFLDVRMPDGNGLEVLPKIREMPSSPEVIIITGAGDPDGAELAIESGAWDYIEKQSPIKDIALSLVRALQYREQKQARTPPIALKREGIVGDSPQMLACLDLVAQASATDVNVLITGETGTGKELFARAIHENSVRARGNFVTVDCAALPETLVESILFGHERGAFTGADRAREGQIKQADGGTLFLDEAGELPRPIQRAFLRVLQERRFRPLGGEEEIESDFRLVAATNRDLDGMVRQGQFREDLLFRLRSLTIELPPLRERPQDIRMLGMHYIARLCDRYGMETKGVSPEFLEALAAYTWPGNVRELLHALESTLAVARLEPVLFPRHLSTPIRVQVARASIRRDSVDAPKAFPTLQDALEDRRESYLRELISYAAGDIKEACRISGLSQSHLYALLKKHDIPRSP